MGLLSDAGQHAAAETRKMLLHGLGARLREFNRPGIRKEKKFVVAVHSLVICHRPRKRAIQ
jgi:hypothetical protein